MQEKHVITVAATRRFKIANLRILEREWLDLLYLTYLRYFELSKRFCVELQAES